MDLQCVENAFAKAFTRDLRDGTVEIVYIEGFDNTHRRHSALGYLSPAAYERRWSTQPVVT